MNPLLQLFDGERDFSLIDDGPVVQALVPSLLEAIVLGDGVPGVTLVGLDVDNATFQVELLGATDTIVVDGINGIVSGLETGEFDIDNDESEFAIFSLDDEDEFRLTDGNVLDADRVQSLLAQEITGDLPRVEITGIDQDNITVEIADGDATDTLIIDQAQEQIAAVARDFVNVSNDEGELGVLDASGDGDDFIFVGDSGDVSDEFEDLASGGESGGFPAFADAFVIGEAEALAMVREVVLGDGVDGVTLLNIDDDTATIRVDGDSEDIIVFDNVDFGTLTDAPMV